MIYALNSDGKKIKAFPNALASCPNCKSELQAKCGQLNIWHWAHKNLTDCDSWAYEPISEWHLKWQNYFNEEYREVYINKGDEYHIADILTENKIEIEIQKSKISTEEIFERELFYDKMIWVVNSFEFKQNLYFKELPTPPFQPVWKQFIKKHSPLDNIAFSITVPIDDCNNQILSALKDSSYHFEFDTGKDKDYWFKLKGKTHEQLDTVIVNAFEAYLIDSKFRQELDERKIYPTNFKWKYLRRTWRTANKPIFLDLNNGYLFQVITLHESGNGFGKIVPKRIFLKKYRG